MLLALPLLLAALPAPEMSAADTSDARCLVTFAVVLGREKTDLNVINFAKLGVYYFQGKLRGRSPDLDLKAATNEVLTYLTGHLDDEKVRCSRELQAAGQALIDASK